MTLSRRAVLVSGSLAPLAANAQDGWPRQAVRIMIPFVPGGVPDITARMTARGYELVASDGPTLAAIQQAEAAKWAGVIRRAGITLEG